MAKIKGNKVEVTRNIVATKAKTTAPTQSMEHKVRFNIKKIKFNDKTSKSEAIERKMQTVSPKTNLIQINNDANKKKNNNIALQAQCKVNDNNINNGTTRKTTLSLKMLNNNVNETTRQLKTAEKTEQDENNFDKTEENNPKGKVTDKGVAVVNKHNRRNVTNNVVETSKPIFARLIKIPVEIKTKTIVAEPSPPKTIRKCKVRLQKTPPNIKPKDTVVSPSTPNTIRRCVVRVQRTPISKRNDVGFDSQLSLPYPLLTVIDENKRKNFSKLSLSKSPITAKKNTDSETNIQLKDNKTKALAADKLTNTSKSGSCIKHLGKLSLRRPTTESKNNATTPLEVIQFEAQQNSILNFEPNTNSTLMEFGFTKGPHPLEKPSEKIKETANNNRKSVSRNLTNKSDEIENILNSLDEEDDMLLKSPENGIKIGTNNMETENKSPSANTKTHKFFKRKKVEDEPASAISSDPNTKNSPSKTRQPLKKRQIMAKRSTIARREKLYEFLSQSQTSDSDTGSKLKDPTADIVKKLIDQGKVRVATNCKGKGKPILKRNRPPKQLKKIKHAADKKIKQNTKTTKKKVNQNNNHIEDDERIDDDRDFIDDFDNDLPTPDVDVDMEYPKQLQLKTYSPKKHTSEQQKGTFSLLARSVLINQAERSDLQKKNAALQLEIRKLISTPKKKKTTQIALDSDLSPIAMPPLRPATKASPWRVDEEAYLPKTFNFNRSSGNLPSFSSDFIPPTPRKEKPKNNQNSAKQQEQAVYIENEDSLPSMTPLQSPQHENIENLQPQMRTPSENIPSVMSSFSSNDSNAENMPPKKQSPEIHNSNDLKQMPNPRKALTFRNPLKAINILDVVVLPPLKNFNKTSNPKENTPEIELFGFEENLYDETSTQTDENLPAISDDEQKDCSKKNKNHPKEDLFGFEDFLSQTELSTQESNDNDTTMHIPNQTIYDKLQDLRKLKPAESEHDVIDLTKERSSRVPLKGIPLFNDDGGNPLNADGMRQRGIKEMLCSTMINPQPSTSKEALKQLKSTNLNDSKRPNFGEALDLSELFKDTEPETTFNERDAHRTYIRPYKRKRRLKENHFVMFMESDESGDEEHSAEQRKHQHSHETDTSSESVPKMKRCRKEPKEKPELKQFVEEFNEMCKEVDSYELIVERST